MKRSYGVLAILLPLGNIPVSPTAVHLTTGRFVSPYIPAYLQQAAPQTLPVSLLKGKKLVLELRSLVTGSAIAVFPSFRDVTLYYRDRLHPILITRGSTDHHRAYTNCRAGLRPLDLPLIAADDTLDQLFTTTGSPQLLCLNASGQVLSLTQGFYLTGTNIREAIGSTGRCSYARPFLSPTAKTTVL